MMKEIDSYTMPEMDMEGAELLVQQIVKQAVYDWRNAKRRLRKHPHNPDLQATVIECERFFLSGWFNTLTDLNGRLFLEKLQEDMHLEERKLKHEMERWLAKVRGKVREKS